MIVDAIFGLRASLRDTLLHKLISDKIRVKDAEKFCRN